MAGYNEIRVSMTKDQEKSLAPLFRKVRESWRRRRKNGKTGGAIIMQPHAGWERLGEGGGAFRATYLTHEEAFTVASVLVSILDARKAAAVKRKKGSRHRAP